MKNLSSAAIVLACISGIMSLPATGNIAMPAQYPWGQISPQLAAFLQAIAAANSQSQANSAQPVTYASATPPAAGVNVGGGNGGKPGKITTTVPATSGGSVVNVPAGSSVSVTGENGGVSGSGSGDQANGGSITVTSGGGNSDNSTATDTATSDASNTDNSTSS